MKHFVALLFCAMVLLSCSKRDRKPYNTSDICFKTTFLDVNGQGQLMSVFFLNGKEGFVSSYDGGIYKTIDSGKNWITLNSTTTLPVRDIFFLDAAYGFAVGGSNSCGGTGCTPPGGFILKTVDEGQTWVKIFTPPRSIEITSVYFINRLLGFCIGGDAIFKTIDGGLNWTETKIDNINGVMMKVKFSDQQNGYAVSLKKLFRTTDGGNSWSVVNSTQNEGYYSIAVSDGVAYLSGQGKIQKSPGNGANWKVLANSPSNIYDLHFTSKDIGYAFGAGNYSGGDFGTTYGAMYCTMDGGNSWNGNGDFKEIGLIKAVSFPSSKLGYAVSGNKLVRISIVQQELLI